MNLQDALKDTKGISVVRGGQILHFANLKAMTIEKLAECDISIRNMPLKLNEIPSSFKSLGYGNDVTVVLDYNAVFTVRGKPNNVSASSYPALTVLKEAYDLACCCTREGWII